MRDSEEINENEKIKAFLDYFKKNFITFNDNNEKEKAIYEKTFWSRNNRILMEVPRTTNILEAWHRTLNAAIGISHPNIARFIQVLFEFEERERVYILQIRSGRNLELRNTNYEKEYKLKILLKSFEIK